ncbi:MAG: nicotinate-nucleotide adenylyltransferase [Actinocrinis sp.]
MNVPQPGGPAPDSAPAQPSRARRVGVMGGTFDPIHHGHLVAASEVASLFELDEVVFVPTGQSWQKDSRSVSSAEDRYLMTVIATASNPRFSVSRADIDRGGPTYTVDTLRDLHAARSAGTEFFFITGADALEQIFTWQDADELFELAHFVGCTRPGHPLADPGLPVGKASLVEIPALAISSTACRERVRRGEPVWYLVPDGIVQYINKRGLYRDPANGGTPLGPPRAWEPVPEHAPMPDPTNPADPSEEAP